MTVAMWLKRREWCVEAAKRKKYRYSYALNNPLIYIDETGEYIGWDDLIAAVVGGVINLGVNIWQGNIIGDLWTTIGKGAAAFGAGAVAGFGALYPQFGGPAWGGATVGATNAWLGGGKGWDIAIGAGVGVASWYAGSYAGQWGAKYLGGAIINGTNITSPVLQGAITGTAGGAVGGYASGFTANLILTGDLRQANKAGWGGAAFGAPIGGISGFSSAYRYSVKNEISPWNGRSLTPKYNDATYDITSNDLRLNSTMERIKDGQSYPHRNDGSIFQNREGVLPLKGQDYYREYVHPTSVVNGAGPQRIIIGRGGEYYYSPDHYKTFIRFKY